MHRNSQKRFYADDGIYFITTNTEKRFPYFEEDIFCEILKELILVCLRIMNFKIFAYKINPDHSHFLFQPGKDYNYSQIMHFIKRNTSRNINMVLNDDFWSGTETEDEEKIGLIREYEKNILIPLKKKFDDQYGEIRQWPHFKWQKSFHFHAINDERDFYYHIEYIKSQSRKHGLSENKYLYIDPMYL